MVQYAIAGKLGVIDIVGDRDEAKNRAEEIYKGYFYKVGFFEARRLRRDIGAKRISENIILQFDTDKVLSSLKQ